MENDKYIGRLLGGRYELIDVVGVGGMAAKPLKRKSSLQARSFVWRFWTRAFTPML